MWFVMCDKVSSIADLEDLVELVQNFWNYPSLMYETLSVACYHWKNKFNKLLNEKVTEHPEFDEKTYYDSRMKEWGLV